MTDQYQDYAAFARAIYETGVLSDPWLDGEVRFATRGVVLSERQANRLAHAAEEVAYAHHEVAQIVLQNPRLIEEFYRLTPYQRAMWETSGGMWHGMARADLFVCEDDSIVCCELNSDTPSGQPEAVLLNQLLRPADAEREGDPNADFERRFVEMLRASHAKRVGDEVPLGAVAIIYPTELTEDLGMVTLFARWLKSAGVAVVSGSPYNVRRNARGEIEVLGTAVDLIVRHYKTDWWAERVPAWRDAPDYPDPEPLDGPLGALLGAEMNDQVTIVNPFGSVVTQNKLSLALMWEEQHRFSPRARAAIRAHIPETRRMINFTPDQLRAEKERWVLKSDYGCEGEETVCGPFVSREIWEKTIDLAVPERFVAQRFFRVAADAQGMLPNYGVFLLGGTAGGFFTRLSRQSTGYASLTAPTFIKRAKRKAV